MILASGPPKHEAPPKQEEGGGASFEGDEGTAQREECVDESFPSLGPI